MIDMNSGIVKEFLFSLNANEIPSQFIHSARVIMKDGNEITLKDDDLARLLSGDQEFSEIQRSDLFLNVYKVFTAIQAEIDYLYIQVRDALQEENQDQDDSE